MSIQNLADITMRAATREVDAVSAIARPAAPAQAQPQHTAPAPSAALSAAARDAERVKAAAQQLDSYLKSSGRSLEFRVDEKSGRVVVKVHDSATGEVIRQIPNEETLRLAESLADPVRGGSAVLDVVA